VASATSHQSPATGHKLTEQRTGAQPQLAVPLEPPAWLAANEGCLGREEAREFWGWRAAGRGRRGGVSRGVCESGGCPRAEGTVPGGVTEARATPSVGACSRKSIARILGRREFAGAAQRIARAARATHAAGRSRGVPRNGRRRFAALQEAGQGSGSAASEASLPRLAASFRREPQHVGAQHAAPLPAIRQPTTHMSRRMPRSSAPRMKNWSAASAAPSSARSRKRCPALNCTMRPGKPAQASKQGLQRASPLRERLAASVRADVEKALQAIASSASKSRRFFLRVASTRQSRANCSADFRPRAAARARPAQARTKRVDADHASRPSRSLTTHGRRVCESDVAQASVLARPAGSEKTSTRGKMSRPTQGKPAPQDHRRSITASSATSKF